MSDWTTVVSKKKKPKPRKNVQVADKVAVEDFDKETDELNLTKVSVSLGQIIQRERHAKGLSQKELAIKIIEKPYVVQDYEAGRGILNQDILEKLEKALGIKLIGKDCGQELPPPIPKYYKRKAKST